MKMALEGCIEEMRRISRCRLFLLLALLGWAHASQSTRPHGAFAHSRVARRPHAGFARRAAEPSFVPSPLATTPFSNVQSAVEAAAPAVALVMPRGIRNMTLQGSAFRVLLEDFADEARPVPLPPGAERSCWLLTAAHVAAPGTTLTIQFPSQPAVPAQLVGRASDELHVDLALIRVDASDLPPESWPAPLRLRPALARVGEACLGLGYPGAVYGPAVSLGIVCAHAPAFALNASAPPRPEKLPAIALDAREEVAPLYVVTDAALAGGMSGGPLLGADGGVLGVNVLVRTELRALGNYALAAPRAVEAVRALLAALMRASADRWACYLYNDSFNTKARVSSVLQEVGLPPHAAEAVMAEAHSRGRAVVRTFEPPDAEESAGQLRDRLRAADLVVEVDTQIL
jgi:S1-C subfamily serine protease